MSRAGIKCTCLAALFLLLLHTLDDFPSLSHLQALANTVAPVTLFLASWTEPLASFAGPFLSTSRNANLHLCSYTFRTY
jgi:hypothetical protein